MSKTKKHHLIFTIGPVQSFIAQARKVHDLYAGSRILSELVDYAIKELPADRQLMFPAPGMDSMPNRFLAIIETSDPQAAGRELEKKVRDRYNELMEKAVKSQASGTPSPAAGQWADLLRISWSLLPESGNGYHDDYQAAETLIGAIKRLKPFGPSSEPAGRKCGLCGERNALFFRPGLDNYGKEKKAPAHLDSSAVMVKNEPLGPGEALCAVCYGKRCYHSKKAYSTTAEIAMLHLEGDQGYKKLVGEYQALFPAGQFDHELLYPENIEETALIKYGLTHMGDRKKELTAGQKKVSEYLKSSNLGKLNKYYAVVRLDGDSMGQLLSGQNLTDKTQLEEFHKQLSKCLAEFASTASNKFTGLGQVIYAGGDDFLGLANLHTLDKAVEMLYSQFQANVAGPLKSYMQNGKMATASIGLAIAHYKAPLAEALAESMAAEKAAKGRDGKNAMGISIIRHSGGRTQAVVPLPDGAKLVFRMADELRSGKYSNNFIGGLERSVMKLAGGEAKVPLDHPSVGLIKLESDLLAKRSCGLKGEKVREEKVKQLREDLHSLMEKAGDGRDNFLSERFLAALDAIDFIKREA